LRRKIQPVAWHLGVPDHVHTFTQQLDAIPTFPLAFIEEFDFDDPAEPARPQPALVLKERLGLVVKDYEGPGGKRLQELQSDVFLGCVSIRPTAPRLDVPNPPLRLLLGIRIPQLKGDDRRR